MNIDNYPRRTGRTTWMLLKALVSDKEKIVILSPTQYMAEYNMGLFCGLIENITHGAGKYTFSRSNFTVEFMGKKFHFIGTDNKRAMQIIDAKKRMEEAVFDEYKDHTCYEIPAGKW